MNRKPKDNLTFEYVNDALAYDAQTGILVWKERPRDHFKNDDGWRRWNGRWPGKVAGTTSSQFYIQIKLETNNNCLAHRLAWLLHYGTWPILEVDHVNGNKQDNRIANLREATRIQNSFNRSKQKNNTSGHKGVIWDKRDKNWRATIGPRYIGNYATKEEAAAAYATAASALYGQFAKT